MYIYLENSYFIPLNEIVSVVSYEKFIQAEDGKEFMENNKNKIIDVAKDARKSLVITDKYLYITSYTTKAIYTRGNEFEKIKENLKLKRR